MIIVNSCTKHITGSEFENHCGTCCGRCYYADNRYCSVHCYISTTKEVISFILFITARHYVCHFNRLVKSTKPLTVTDHSVTYTYACRGFWVLRVWTSNSRAKNFRNKKTIALRVFSPVLKFHSLKLS